MNKKKYNLLMICLVFLIVIGNLQAQTNSSVNSNNLQFLDDGNGFIQANYGLNGFSLQNDFNSLNYNSASSSLYVGSDLSGTTIGTDGLHLTQCCVSPSSQLDLMIDQLVLTQNDGGALYTSTLTKDNLVYGTPFGGYGAFYGLDGLEIGTDFNNTTINSIQIQLFGSGNVSIDNSGKMLLQKSAGLVNDEGILTARSTTTAGTNSDAIGVHGINDVDDFYGIGVLGKGGFQGVRGVVNPILGATNIYYGMRGLVSGGSGTNYAVYGSADGAGTNYAGYFSGDATVTGTFDNSSDRKLKRHIKDYDRALEKIMLLQPRTYQFQTDKYPTMHLAKGEQFGFIAQEIQEVLPELVKTNVHASGDKSVEKFEYLGVNYIGLIPVLTKAIQEQQDMMEEKDDRITNLETELSDIKNMLQQLLLHQAEGNSLNAPIHQQQIQLTAPMIEQNQPNPFNGRTTISYFIPESTQTAQVQITDVNGKVLKIETILRTGHGQIHLDAKAMPIGTYAYSLIVDGQLVETKQMILMK